MENQKNLSSKNSGAMKNNQIKHYTEKRYLLANLQPSFLRIDVLLFCYYSIYFKKSNRVKIYNIWRNLTYYDYHYYTEYMLIKSEIISLFPLYNNNHRRCNFFKINKNLINYWGQKFEINYQQHERLFILFKSFENETGLLSKKGGKVCFI